MSGVAASFDQATGILKLLCETRWTKEEMQRRFFARWGLLRDIGLAVGDGKISEEQVRAMHPLFYKKSAEVKAPELPTEMTVGGVTYEILSFLREGEKCVRSDVMVERAKEMNANLGEEDCDRFKKNQSDIPPVLRGKIVFVFPNYRRPDDHELVAFLYWDGVDWVKSWHQLDDHWSHDWRGRFLVLRRKSAA